VVLWLFEVRILVTGKVGIEWKWESSGSGNRVEVGIEWKWESSGELRYRHVQKVCRLAAPPLFFTAVRRSM
jgi:hypothetical protein